MPVYTFRCDECGHKFDKQLAFSEAAPVACPNCRKHALNKVYKPAGVVFKGSGFYVTDKRSAKSSTAGPGSTKSNGNKESKKDSKTESKAESSKSKSSND
jgi:putative FmdB family regulatory protein